MIYTPSPIAVILFVFFVITVLILSKYFAKRTTSSKGYFAAGGTIHWAVNGIAFAGDYLSAASFLGICGMIATAGYDGFLYSIGYLAGWIVALFVIAEPMKRLGKYTFTDAIDSKYNSRGIQLTSAISTLVVSVCYLIPQMVGAGDLVTPLLGIPHYAGVIMVGVIVIFIVATAGMTSTTYVQFIKGGLLIIFSTILSFYVVNKGLSVKPGQDYHEFKKLEYKISGNGLTLNDKYKFIKKIELNDEFTFVKLEKNSVETWWRLKKDFLEECLFITNTADGKKLYNGKEKSEKLFYQVGHIEKIVKDGIEVKETGKLGFLSFLSVMNESVIVRFLKKTFKDGNDSVNVWYQQPTKGKNIMRPGLKFSTGKGSAISSKIDFISLMLALFFGTAALPHILIRYYTVPSQRCARKSTIVAISAIGFFYILTMYMGLGAMVNGVLDVESSNMAAPLLAKSFGTVLFSIISAIAFATVLGTVSGLIVAASGAVAHDLINNFFRIELTDDAKVKIGKTAAVAVGIIAIILGILFKGMNVAYLVGLAFAVAASANLPAIIMLLFWKKTTKRGIAFSIIVGMLSSLIIIMMSPSMYERYGLNPADAIIKFNNPGIISIPLSFITLYVVSLFTQPKKNEQVQNV